MCGTLPARRFAFRANQSVYPGGIKIVYGAQVIIGTVAGLQLRSDPQPDSAVISLVAESEDIP
jgi:hypothetical protein